MINHLALHTGRTRYILAIVITSVLAWVRIDGLRAEGIGVQSPVSFMSLEAEQGLLCSPRLLTYVCDLPRHPSPLLLGPGWRPHVHASLVSSQNFLAPRLIQSLNQNWPYFLSSQSK